MSGLVQTQKVHTICSQYSRNIWKPVRNGALNGGRSRLVLSDASVWYGRGNWLLEACSTSADLGFRERPVVCYTMRVTAVCPLMASSRPATLSLWHLEWRYGCWVSTRQPLEPEASMTSHMNNSRAIHQFLLYTAKCWWSLLFWTSPDPHRLCDVLPQTLKHDRTTDDSSNVVLKPRVLQIRVWCDWLVA